MKEKKNEPRDKNGISQNSRKNNTKISLTESPLLLRTLERTTQKYDSWNHHSSTKPQKNQPTTAKKNFKERRRKDTSQSWSQKTCQ